MTESDDRSDAALEEIYRECLSRGYLDGMDFYIEGHPTSLSSELVMLESEGGSFRVVYSDMGRESVIATGDSVDAVREIFFDELARLAHGRGRGPAPRPRSAPAVQDDAIVGDDVWDQLYP